MPATVTCPAGHYSGASATNAQCRTFSYPRIVNDLFWQNRVFNIQVGNIGTGLLSQQNLVTLVPQLSQAMTGQCAGGASYWDIGVRGDTGPNSHQASGTLPANYFTLNPTYSILTDVTSYGATAAHNSSNNPNVASQYCNGSRVPPENGGMGYAVPPGIADATLPNPVFNLTPAATVDEGNNWINMTYGPLVLPNPTLLPEQSLPAPLAPSAASYGDYGLTGTSAPAIGHANLAAAPPLDFFGTPRSNHADIGAVEYAGTLGAIVNVTGGPLAFGNVTTGRTSAAQSVTLHNTGGSAFTGITVATNTPSTGFARTTGSANCGTTLAAGANCNIYVVFSPTATGTVAGTLTITGNVAASGSPVSLSGTGVAPIVAAAWIPPTWSPSQARNCPGSTSAQRAACAADPMQLFMLTNTGNVTITGVGAASLAGASPGDYTIIFSTCGPGFFGTTTLTAGSSCFALLQFRPRTADAANSVRNATLSVTDSAGTQVATLSGMAN
jgi:hypothetical protein